MAPISDRMSSHRAAQGVIYADQLHHAGYDVTINFGGRIENYNDWDVVAVYHGNDWGGTVNMFGGVKAYGAIDQIVNLSKFKGEVWSLAIPFPDYAGMIKPRVDKEPDAHISWKQVDWVNLSKMVDAKMINTNDLHRLQKIAIGDSHAISMYRAGWQVNSVPFKTLHGALAMGLESFLLGDQKYYAIETYFGNIDIRHHLARQADPAQATKTLVKEYVGQCRGLLEKYNADTVRIWEPLPIENESRKLPKTGYYKDTPFYGSWEKRNKIRKLFRDQLLENSGDGIQVFLWVDGMLNQKGELDFEFMEKPQSVHLSRASYPHWTGKEWNDQAKNKIYTGLEP